MKKWLLAMAVGVAALSPVVRLNLEHGDTLAASLECLSELRARGAVTLPQIRAAR